MHFLSFLLLWRFICAFGHPSNAQQRPLLVHMNTNTPVPPVQNKSRIYNDNPPDVPQDQGHAEAHKRILYQTAEDIGFCGFIAATNIASIYSEWSCTSSGETSTDPCGTPGWTGVETCSGSGPAYISIEYLGLNGTIPSTLGCLTSIEYLYLDHNSLTGWFLSVCLFGLFV